MRLRYRRSWFNAVARLGGFGYLLAGPQSTCTSFTGESLFVTTDFCFIFDCQGGIFGGTIDPCTGEGSGNQTFETDDNLPLFNDCPNNP